MMVYEAFTSAWDNFGKFIYQFQPETKTLIRKLERILNKSYRQNLSLLFNETYFNRSQIFKLVKNLDDHRAMGSSPSMLLITQEKYEYIINNFAYHTQKCLQLNGRHLEDILLAFLYILGSCLRLNGCRS